MYGADPPLTAVVIEPSDEPQITFVSAPFTAIAVGEPTVNVAVALQPPSSVTVTSYDHAAMFVSVFPLPTFGVQA